MDILDQLEEIALLIGGKHDAFLKAEAMADYLLRLNERINSERNKAMSDLETLSLRLTGLIKQNSALAAENERLEKLLGEYKHDLYYSGKDVEHYKSVIKAAKEQEPVAVHMGGHALVGGNKYFDLILNRRSKELPKGNLYAHPVPAQSPETRSSLPDNVTRVVDASTGQVKQSVTAVEAVSSGVSCCGCRIEKGRLFCSAQSSLDRCPSHEPAENSKLYQDVSHWYARLTSSDAVTDDGEHVGYCCTMKMMDEMETILSVKPLHPVLQAYGVQDSGVVDHD